MTEQNTTEVFVSRMNLAQQPLFAFIRTLVPHADDARDVLSETNLALWRKQAEYSAEHDFWPWACRFARTQVMAYRERRRRDRHVFSEGLIEVLASESERSTAQFETKFDFMEQCVELLTARQRELLELRYSESLSVQEIAVRGRKSTGSISDALYRIRITLGNCIRGKMSAAQAN